MINVQDLTKKYGKEKGITDFNFHFEKGNVYGLIGPNGAGKTTLIKLLVNFINKDKGSISKNFEDNTRLNNISYMPDFDMLVSGSVKKNIEFFNLTYKDLDLEVLDNILEKFEIEKDGKVKNLSTGKSKAFRFALCVSRKVKVYILDEPFSGIDVITRTDIVENIISVIDIEESVVIVSSHELHDMDQLLDYVLLIDKSHLLITKSVEEIKEEKNESLYTWFIETVKSNKKK
ncbi:ABC transporter ATP-binding protein YtrB [Candidatus Izimaplasma bacterium HR1]|jgi:ABC-2 type transport system ATP-binding protein|uniref:ABC transporter ATP-binding protein n=1 Tax=Candidatus Izimoplasma sp. HR1 TaxID=1541959 RepID=UPI0004F9066A|nr:ABC transporter ATP-binding protein YtrB [Candidatus Izimaplasma bacterium HR1]